MFLGLSLNPRLPKWDLNLLLEWFTSEEFWPPESCRWYRLLQKTFVLTLFSSGKHILEIATLSLNYKRIRKEDVVILLWPERFAFKSHKVGFIPTDPSKR